MVSFEEVVKEELAQFGAGSQLNQSVLENRQQLFYPIIEQLTDINSRLSVVTTIVKMTLRLGFTDFKEEFK